jgi:hypothetical protein
VLNGLQGQTIVITLSQQISLEGRERQIKEIWNDSRKYLHQTFQQYYCSGQHPPRRSICGFEQLLGKHFPGQNSLIYFPSAMVYSIAVLDVTNFEGIGRHMPDGSGINASSSCAAKGKKRIIRTRIGSHESSLPALCLMIEFGSVDDKGQAMEEIKAIAFHSRASALATATTSEEGRTSTDDTLNDDKVSYVINDFL